MPNFDSDYSTDNNPYDNFQLNEINNDIIFSFDDEDDMEATLEDRDYPCHVSNDYYKAILEMNTLIINVLLLPSQNISPSFYFSMSQNISPSLKIKYKNNINFLFCPF